MTLPKYPGKHAFPATFSAADVLSNSADNKKISYPQNMVLFFQNHPFRYITKKFRGREIPIALGKSFALKNTGEKVGIAGDFGIGAPVAVFIMEVLAAFGVKKFVLAGFAGGLHENQQPGEIVLCSRALRDEGTSYHYMAPSDFAEPDPGLTAQIGRSLEQLGHPYTKGSSWTIDAPFRETFEEILYYGEKGILTVEMEAAALFAAAKHLGVACSAVFAVGDTPKNGKWQFNFDRSALDRGLEQIADAAVYTLRDN